MRRNRNPAEPAPHRRLKRPLPSQPLGQLRIALCQSQRLGDLRVPRVGGAGAIATPFTVVGVAERRGSTLGGSQDGWVIIPLDPYYQVIGRVTNHNIAIQAIA